VSRHWLFDGSIKHQRLLSENNMPPEAQAAWIETFKKMPDWQRKLTLQGFR